MDLRKLQRVVGDALEDVKAQDIRVYNTTALSALYERMVIASGTSNRQTRALASRVRERVKQAGGRVASVEGVDSGEWVLVDLGDIVVHIMQPAIRSYYNLEELWGAKPVRVKLGAPEHGARVEATDEYDEEPATRASRAARNDTRGSASRTGAASGPAGAAQRPPKRGRSGASSKTPAAPPHSPAGTPRSPHSPATPRSPGAKPPSGATARTPGVKSRAPATTPRSPAAMPHGATRALGSATRSRSAGGARKGAGGVGARGAPATGTRGRRASGSGR